MSTSSIPSIAMASVIAALGAFSLFVYVRRRTRPPELLSAGVTCLLFSLYGFTSARLYSAGSYLDGRDWQRYGVAALVLSCVALLKFVGDYTGGRVSRPWFWSFAAILGVFSALDVFWHSELMWRYDVPAVKHVGGPFGMEVTYNEIAVGPLVSLQYALVFVWAAYAMYVSARFYRDGDRRRGGRLMIALAILFASALNDTFVSVELYEFYYTSEYAYMAIVFLMAHALAGESVSAAELIQERAHLEERLRQAEKMEAVGRLAGGIAHDLNNMLTPIVGYVDIARRRPRSVDELMEFMARIGEAAEHSRRLTWQLLAFGRKQLLHMKVLRLNDVVAGAEQMVRRLIPEDIEIEFALSDDAGHVRADATQLQQIFINLAINARDAMPAGGRMRVETRFERVAGSGACAVLVVRDNGHGMDAGTAGRAFEPFFTTKDRSRGTGLGLSTVYGIVRQHDGHIELKTAPGEGSEFRVYLPRTEPAESPPPAAMPDRDGAFGGKRVLVVEDEASVRTLVREVLRGDGHTVMEAGHPEEALALVGSGRAGPIDLLLTDVVMPGMSGFQLHERLVERLGPLRVLYMSGYSGDAIAERGVSAEALALLHKPFSVADLLAAANAVMTAPPVAAAGVRRDGASGSAEDEGEEPGRGG
jgi:signal transduction histidine kinase/ActR/RegA family two-component response regulator